MNWNTKPESTNLPPPYSKSQSSILHQYLIQQPSTTSQNSVNYPSNNQEACMYSNNSNSVSQPLPNMRNYKTPQTPVSNMQNRTFVTSQTKVERITYGNVKAPQQPTHNLQKPSGVMQNLWLNSPIRNSASSHTEAVVSHQTDFGANMPYMHVPQSQLVTSDTYSMQLQMTPSNSVRGPPVTCQGNQGLNHSLPDQLVNWAQQYTSNELTYPDYRAPPKQYSYSSQSFLHDPTVQTQNMPSTSVQIKNNQLSTSAQTLQSKHSAPVSYQYAMENNKRLPPYNCRYGSQPGQIPQPGVSHLPVEVPQSSEIHLSEKMKDLYKGFQQQWQNTNENSGTIGNLCEFNVKQSYNEPLRSVDGVHAPVQNNQERRMFSCNTNANLVLDTNMTKEKLVRDIKSLVEIKKKFSELARKIKINKDLLMAAGCSKTANNSYSEPGQHSEFPTKGMPAKSDNHCSMELLATCLSLWKNQPPKPTGEKALISSEEEQCNESGANTTAVRSSMPVAVKSLCSVEGNSQKTVNPAQTVLSVVTQSYESSSVGVPKGTELQIAVVSPLVLSTVKTLPEKGVDPIALPGPLYPVVKEGSVCSLQNQLAESTITAALNFDVKVPVSSSPASAEVSLPVQKEKQHEPMQDNSQDTTDASLGKLPPLDNQQALPKPRDSTVGSGHTLQIESICSLAEGEVSYNSQIAEIFNSFPLKNAELQKPPSPSRQVISSQQNEQVDHTTENDFSFRKDKSVQCTGVPLEVSDQPKFLQPPELSTFESIESIEANRQVLEENNVELTTKKESTAKDGCCSPAAPQPDTCPQEMDTYPSNFAQGPTVDDPHDEKEPVLYLHGQLSELLKEFPYGIESVTRCESSVERQEVNQVLENQTSDKTGCVSEEDTDQIQITILSSEQIKELFPEDDQPCHIDRLEDPEKEKAVAEVGSLCDSQTPREGCDPIMLDSEKDKIHCCALGWLSKVYEGVPQCQCGSSKSATSEEERGNGKRSPLVTNSCKQVDGSITVVEVNSVPNNLKTPLTSAEKGHYPELHDSNIKTSKEKQNSSLRIEQEGTSQLSLKCESKDPKDTSKLNQDSSLKVGRNTASQFKSDSLSRNTSKKPLKFHEVSFNSCKNLAFSEQVSQESLQEKPISQNSGLLKAQQHLLPKKNQYNRNSSLVLSASPEKKKLKFKAGGSKIKYFEKRKTDCGITPDVEIKKKKYENQEQNKNEGGTVNLCSPMTNLNERDIVQEKTVLNSESSDLKGQSSKTTRVITVAEYLQRQKNKDTMGNNASKNSVGSVPCDSERMSSTLLVPPSSEKVIQKYDSAEAAEVVSTSTSSSKDLKAHHTEESSACNVSRNVRGKADGKQPDKSWIDKTKSEKRLTNVSNEAESGQVLSQAKEHRKLYLNRVAFKCTERESICLTKLESASQKVSKDKESHEDKPKTDAMEKPSLLEFKLCPDTLLKTTSSFDKEDNPTPGKDPVFVQVSGIKSTKEDWLKCGPTRTKIPETSQEIDNANSRVPKRSFSADGFETLQNPVKDSNTMFQTYKQMYLDKKTRSQSFENGPVK